jgi:hypothetical protein
LVREFKQDKKCSENDAKFIRRVGRNAGKRRKHFPLFMQKMEIKTQNGGPQF